MLVHCKEIKNYKAYRNLVPIAGVRRWYVKVMAKAEEELALFVFKRIGSAVQFGTDGTDGPTDAAGG